MPFGTFEFSLLCMYSLFKNSAEGRLGGTAVKRLPSAQGVILALWDRAPQQAVPL